MKRRRRVTDRILEKRNDQLFLKKKRKRYSKTGHSNKLKDHERLVFPPRRKHRRTKDDE
jgi:hypothetical protein